MSNRPVELDRLQRWMQSVITHPAGIENGIAARGAQNEIAIAPAEVESVVARSQQLTSVERLRIYGNAYFARLIECLKEEFPAVLDAVGEEAFHGFAFAYLQEHPSTSYTLADLGAVFPQYLAKSRPPRESDADAPDFADFIADLARLERIYSEVFDGPGEETLQLLNAADLQSIKPEQWPLAKLVPVDSLRLEMFQFPVHEYATAVRRQLPRPEPIATPTYLVISRREYVVRRCPVSRDEYRLLQLIVDGDRVGDAINSIADESKLSDTMLAERLHEWFWTWTSAGYFRAVMLDASTP